LEGIKNADKITYLRCKV